MFLALLDTWPMQRPTWMKDGSKISRITPQWVKTSLTLIQTSRLPCPDWLTKRFLMPVFHHICFFSGWYLLSQPARAGHREYSSTTPGWIWLDSMIPESYDDNRYYRYWQTWGGLLLIYGVLRIRWVQRCLTTRPLQFLGYISFMLYIVHTSWFRIFPDRFHTLIGYAGANHSDFWDMHRADLQLAMYERAKEIGVEFEFGAIVTRHEFEDPAVILADGRYMEGDLIIAADGVNLSSACRVEYSC